MALGQRCSMRKGWTDAIGAGCCSASLCSGGATALCCCTCRFATAYEGKYSDSIQQAYVYPSTNYLDDLAWGATWLYQLTNEAQFLTVSSLCWLG